MNATAPKFAASTHGLKTRTVRFSNGVVRNAALKVPAEDCSLFQLAQLIRESYLEWVFNGSSIFSDEVAVSSIGKSHYFAGALGGYETRLSLEDFAVVKANAESDVSLALEVVRYRRCNAGLSNVEVYRRASRNESLSERDRQFLRGLAEVQFD
jgi:hypothetical protein